MDRENAKEEMIGSALRAASGNIKAARHIAKDVYQEILNLSQNDVSDYLNDENAT